MTHTKARDLRVEDEDHPALPKGHKTARVHAALQSAPVCSILFISDCTGLDRRTVTAILYSLQSRGLAAPVNTPPDAPINSGRHYSLVDGVTIFATPIVRCKPFRARSIPKQPAQESPEAFVSNMVASLDWRIPDSLPSWFAPRLPAQLDIRSRRRQAPAAELFAAT